jgi:hypothetical protein
MIETRLEQRRDAYRRRESERDALIQSVFENYRSHFLAEERSVPGAGNGLAPFDAQYIAHDLKGQRIFVVIDRATTGLHHLADSIRRQIEGRI